MERLDLIDRKIVAELMRDATRPIADIAALVGLSQTPCWKRIQRLEEAGVLTGRVALVDPARIGFGLYGLRRRGGARLRGRLARGLNQVVAAMPEIMEVFRTAGEMDYLLRVAVFDMAAFDGFYRRLTDAVPIKNVTSHFAMERIKVSTVYPVDTTSR